MKQLKQTIRLICMSALALITVACSNDDNDITQQPSKAEGIPFTATISMGGNTTRALSEPDGDGKIQATWTTGEHVALVYKVGSTTVVTDAVVTKQGDNSATISATIDAGVTTGTPVTLIYPYSAVNLTAGDDYGKIKTNVFEGQTGELTPRATPDGTSISEKYDLRIGTGKISLATTPASLKENVTMASQIAIWKLTLQSGGSDLSATKLDVYFGGMTASATKAVGASEYYMAVPAGATGITFIASDGTDSYIFNRNTDVTLNASSYYQSTVTLTKQTTRAITTETGELTLNDGDIVTGTGGANTQLKIANGATVTLAGVTNTSITIYEVAGIKCEGNATIILADGTTNTLKGYGYISAVYVSLDKTLTIRGGGTLIADNSGAGVYGAGIGGGYWFDCGNIVIEGGNITAKGSTGAGIGGGNGHSCGTITILGGTIQATGSGQAAGIGSGKADNTNITCGAITISGGNITAAGGGNAAGIGSGHANQATNTCGDITISGSAQVTANGADAAGIGSGRGNIISSNIFVSVCGAISITGGTVTATGGNNAAGIGSGWYGKFTSISIGSGITSVTATRSDDYYNVPIGKGRFDQGSGAVTIDTQTLSDAQTQGTENTTYGNIKVAVSAYGTNNGLTWTLTPAP